MKRLMFFIVFIPNLIFSQDLPTPPASGAAFPIGSKFSIKLYPIDSKNFHFSVIEFEPFDSIVETWENDSLFDNMGQDSTITFYFCFGTHGDTEVERESNMKILLLMKNYTEYSLNYTSEIQRKEQKKKKKPKYKPTSNIGTFSGAKGTEMWPYMIYSIRLRDFKKMDLETNDNID
jgi:hypothetical protein